MKKVLYLLLITNLFIPILVNAAECDPSKVYIESIGIENQSGNVEELENASGECAKYIKKIDSNDKIKNIDEGTYLLRSTSGCPA